MFDGVFPQDGVQRLYRITRDTTNHWHVRRPEAGPDTVFDQVDSALAFVRGDCGAREGTVELVADNMYIVKHVGGGLNP